MRTRRSGDGDPIQLGDDDRQWCRRQWQVGERCICSWCRRREAEDDGIKPLPDRLVFDLTAQRTLALRNALAGDVDIAFVAALHAFVLQVFYRFAPDTCLEISLKSGSFSQVDGLAETSWAKEIAERHEAWDRDLPDDEAEALGLPPRPR